MTQEGAHVYLSEGVSIHTPTKGVTKSKKAYIVKLLFQSTHPRRVWPGFGEYQDKELEFQSTHPRRVWPSVEAREFTDELFQSTHPRRVWHLGIEFVKGWHGCFNPHTHEGCDYCNGSNMLLYLGVSIHTPTKGVTTHTLRCCGHFAVSIHTPTKGVTGCTHRLKSVWLSFNPHTHEGCDKVMEAYNKFEKVSIHTPTKGVTPARESISYPS